MKIKPFELERYFAKYEFTTKYLLSSSECQALTLKELLDIADAEMLGMYENLGLGYTQSSGHPMLIEEIKQLYENASEENILTLAPQEGIFIAMNVMLDKDDHVVCTHPGYQSLYEVGNSIGCDVSYWKVQYNSEGAYFDVDEMESLIKDSTKAIVINSPHNPTGYMPSYDEYMRIFDIARKHGIWVISDEMYRFLERGGQETLPFAVMCMRRRCRCLVCPSRLRCQGFV